MNKLIFHPGARDSEDIDLVQEIPGSIGSLLDAVREAITPWLGRPKVERLTRGTTMVWRFETTAIPVTKSRLKLEINTREHGWVGVPCKVGYRMENTWFSGQVEVSAVALEDLLATKVRALYQRRKGRDFFDLHTALERFPALDLQKVMQGFRSVMTREGHAIQWRDLEGNMREKLDHPLFGQTSMNSEGSEDDGISETPTTAYGQAGEAFPWTSGNSRRKALRGWFALVPESRIRPNPIWKNTWTRTGKFRPSASMLS